MTETPVQLRVGVDASSMTRALEPLRTFASGPRVDRLRPQTDQECYDRLAEVALAPRGRARNVTVRRGDLIALLCDYSGALALLAELGVEVEED